jgi:hypothetical protein
MKNLISMTDFVLSENYGSYDLLYFLHVKYAIFLKQPLTLGMFVPCDLEGNVLEEPVNHETWLSLHNSKGSTIGFDKHLEYQEAKERCLFEGFQVEEHEMNTYSVRCENNILNPMWCFIDNIWVCAKGISTIEDLIKYSLELTPTALKQLGL